MKKQFFYAAFALAMMASCTSEDSPTLEQPTTPEEDKVAIELGIDSPTISAAMSRGTGSVGDVDASNNKWNAQRIYIAMVNNNGTNKGDLATEKVGNTTNTQNILSWDTYEYRAPSNETSGLIKIYQKGTYENLHTDGKPITGSQTPVDDKGVKQYVYYPVGTGTYDFYGWHVDATPTSGDAVPTNGTPNIADEVAKIENITIDGTQDIMGARTKEFIYDNYKTGLTIDESSFNTLKEGKWNFSARTARNGIKPILKFEHQLARLKFFVRAGSPNTLAKDGYTVADDPTSTGAMFVTSLSVLDMVNKITMDLNATVDGKSTIVTESAQGSAELVPFYLGSKKDGIVTPNVLDPVAPSKLYNKNDNTYKGDQVGESIMFFPNGNSANSIDLNLALKQKVIISENEVTGTKTYDYKYQDTKVTVNASSISGGNGSKKFEAGYSYNIYITIYGFEQIEVTAELAAWKDGGNVDVDVEEGTSSDSSQGSGTQTPTQPINVAFNVTGENGAALTNAVITVQSPTEGVTVNGLNVTLPAGTEKISYTIQADGYNDLVVTNADVSASINAPMEKTGDDEETTTAVSVNVVYDIQPAEGTTPSITILEENGANPATKNAEGKYDLFVGKKYKITVEVADYTQTDNLDLFTVTKDMTITVNMTKNQQQEGQD